MTSSNNIPTCVIKPIQKVHIQTFSQAGVKRGQPAPSRSHFKEEKVAFETETEKGGGELKSKLIPHICHFFTQAKFLENKIYTEIYTVNCQFGLNL